MALMIPIVALSIPIVAIMVKPLTDRMKIAERREAREMYERIALEKLDVIKTAVAMGYSDDELSSLDQRLEKLIGKDALSGLLDKQPDEPMISAELKSVDLQSELDRLKRAKQK